MNTRNLTVALFAVGALAGVTGCGDSGAAASPTTSAVPSLAVPSKTASSPASSQSSSNSTATAPATAPATGSGSTASAAPSVSHQSTALPSADGQQAIQAVKDWKSTLERIYADPTMATSQLGNVSTGSALRTSEGFVESMRGKQLHTSGGTTWVSTHVDSAQTQDSVKVVAVSACVDVSKLKLLDATGKDVTPKSRRPRVKENYLVTSAQGSAQWKVSDITSTGAAC